MKTAYWLQGGGCGGDTFSFLSSEFPNVVELLHSLNIKLLWHPSFSHVSPTEHDQLFTRILTGEQPLDILLVEGSIICGPAGTGMFHTKNGQPKKEIVFSLASMAQNVLAVGTCASFGGFGSDTVIEAKGLQFTKREKGGFLGVDFTAQSGQQVINLAGCPCHHDVITGAIASVANGIQLELDKYQRPLEWYGTTVHQGCTRNEYHEYRVEESDFGEMGCLFFHMGCAGPLVPGPCNKLLWNQQSSKPRAGVPCFGCTDPEFPKASPFFETPNIEGIPLSLPMGVNRAHYMVYKGMAAAAAPEHLQKRTSKV
ncbi:NADH:ubiquinone oxidoreductase [Desulfogranum marinum]|uniref:NADH-quinone oxidoreductase subunit B family protein n=1 Tax=Desulfogranum marinum TaxID=453220 RepID=UPI001965FD3D|nr:NADH:ubiquinone oxidoreductase [Desulfogranum marinum]MBM9512850.1 NADH:ubiquinone oxidoreductase [Desulfogranum marinum]